MRIVIVAPWGERLGGAERALWTFLRRVDRERIDPFVVFTAEGPFVGEIEALGIDTAVFETGRLRDARGTASAIAHLTRALRRQSPDLVLSWTTKSHLISAPAASIAGYGRRCAWWQHGVPGTAVLDRLAARLPARAVLCSSSATAAAQQRAQRRTPSLAVFPPMERPAEGDAARVREELSIPNGRFVVGICGRLQPWKRQDAVISAVAELVDAGHDAHALVVGGTAHGLSPEYGPELHTLADERGLRDRVTFTGQVPDTSPYLAAMDVLVNASAFEPFGMVLPEAMAAGTPVVAFAAGGPLDIVEPGRSGLLVSGDPVPVLAEALGSLAADLALRAQLAAGGRERFDAVFAPEILVDRLTETLISLAAR